MNLSSTSTSLALVLGGGGSAGNAWLIGVVAGLLGTGLDVRTADLIVGTSAGATAAAQITAADPSILFAEVVGAPTPPAAGTRPPNAQSEHLARLKSIIAAADDAADMRRRMGALAMTGADEFTPRWRSIVAGRLPSHDWPTTTIRLTAVDAESGEPTVFDRESETDLVDAVTASTSGGRAYRIGDRYFIDGGYRRNENADLATGFSRVLVLAPLGGATLHPLIWRMQLAAQVEELTATGSLVEIIVPDTESRNAFGDNLLDPTTRPPAARAGYAQGVGIAERVAELW